MENKIIILIMISILGTCGFAFGADSQYTVTFAGQWPFHPSKGIAVDAARDLVFLGDGEKLSILDSELTLISLLTVTRTGEIAGMYYSSDERLLYTACKADGLKIIDVSEPDQPAISGEFQSEIESDEINGIFVTGGKGYLASGSPGTFSTLSIIDLSDPENIVFLGSVELPGAFFGFTYALDVIVSHGYAWVADLYNGIFQVDISNPGKPELVKILAPLPGSRDLEISGDFLYTALEGNGMAVLNIADPEKPEETCLYVAEGIEKAVRIDEDIAYIAYSIEGIRALDITDKAKPVHNKAWSYSQSGANSIALVPDRNALYLTGNQSGMEKIDIRYRANMQKTAAFDTPADAVAIEVSGSYLYSLDNVVGSSPEKEGLRIYKINIINKAVIISLMSSCPTPGEASDIFLSGDYIYVADGDEGFQIIDTSDKSNPEIIGNIDTPGDANGIFVSGEYAFIADGGEGLAIINITDKAVPEYVTSLKTPGTARNVFISGGFAFVADNDQGLQIVDISDKNNPKIQGSAQTQANAYGVAVDGNHAYVATGDKGLAVFDITDKSGPRSVASFDTGGTAVNVSIAGNYAYVADSENGVTVVNISDPALPVEETGWSFQTSGIASDVHSGYTSGDNLFAFIADGSAGIVAINLQFTDDDDVNPGNGGGGSGGCFVNSIFR